MAWLQLTADTLRRLSTAGYLLFFIGINTALSLPLLCSPMLAESDAYVRALKAWEPWAHGNFWHLGFTDSWLPLHALILRISLLFSTDLHYAPRILTFLISSLGIPVFYAYIRNRFTRNYALFTTLLFTLFPLRLVLGTQTLSEGIFLPLFLLVITAVNKIHLTPHALVTTLIGITLITGIRYDGWFLLPYIWLNIWMRLRPISLRINATALSLATPLWYLTNTQRATGDTFSFLHQKISIAHLDPHPEFFNIMLTAQAVTDALTKVVPLPFLVSAAFGFFILHARAKKSYPYLPPKNEPHLLTHFRLLLPVYFIATLFIQVYLGTMEWMPERYFLITATLLIPYIPVGIKGIYTANRAMGITLALTVLALVPFYGSHQYKTLTSGQFHPTGTSVLPNFLQLTAYLKTQPRPSYRYVRSEYLNESYAIAMSYFLTDPEIIYGATLAVPQKTFVPKSRPDELIVEKPIPDLLIADGNIHYENEFFAVIAYKPQSVSE